MKKLVCMLGISMLAAGAAQADVVALDLAAAGSNGVGTVVSTAVTAGTATFDIVYTLGATANTNNPFVQSNGSQMGVGSDGDISNHYLTLEGNDAEGMSFSSLSIANFVANDSGYVLEDIENLTFSSITFGAVANNQDGVNISFTGFGVDTANQLLSSGGTGGANPYTVDLTGLANYTSPETGLFVLVDNANSSNRWSVNGLQVTYTIPEPATLGMIAASGFGVLFIRRIFMI